MTDAGGWCYGEIDANGRVSPPPGADEIKQ